MAQRRMFSKEITNCSDFLMMSQWAQNLYFHFWMNADDDWFCEVFTIMRMTDSKPDDLSVLHSKWFIFVVDNKVCIVKSWHENNQIRLDRYKKSKYLDDPKYADIYSIIMYDKIKEITVYTDVLEWRKPNGNQMAPQDRLGKDSIEEYSVVEVATLPPVLTPIPKKRKDDTTPIGEKAEAFEKFWKLYPNKKGKEKARIKWMTLDPAIYNHIYYAVQCYTEEKKWEELKYIKHWSTRVSEMAWNDYKRLTYENVKQEMIETLHGDKDKPDTIWWQAFKPKYRLLFGEYGDERWFEDKEKAKQELQEKRKQYRLSHNGQELPW